MPPNLGDPILGKPKLPSWIPYLSKPAVCGGLGPVAVPPRRREQRGRYVQVGHLRTQSTGATGCSSSWPHRLVPCVAACLPAAPAAALYLAARPHLKLLYYHRRCWVPPTGGQWRWSMAEARGSDVVSSSPCPPQIFEKNNQ